MDVMWIRGVPHNVDTLREVEKTVGGKIVTNETMLANLDKIVSGHEKRTGKLPVLVEDSQTHERFAVVVASIPSVTGLHIKTKLYVKLSLVVAVGRKK